MEPLRHKNWMYFTSNYKCTKYFMSICFSFIQVRLSFFSLWRICRAFVSLVGRVIKQSINTINFSPRTINGGWLGGGRVGRRRSLMKSPFNDFIDKLLLLRFSKVLNKQNGNPRRSRKLHCKPKALQIRVPKNLFFRGRGRLASPCLSYTVNQFSRNLGKLAFQNSKNGWVWYVLKRLFQYKFGFLIFLNVAHFVNSESFTK